MWWLYRLQQRLALTRNEALVILTLSGLFLFGLLVRQLHRRATPLPPDIYAEADHLFAEGTATVTGGALPAGHATADTAGGESVVRAPADGIGPEEAPPGLASSSGRVNLNTATSAELERLPRIGPATAARIIAYRARHGPFQSTRQLLEIRGIGEKTLARLEPLVTVE